MLKPKTCACYHCGKVFSAEETHFFDRLDGQLWTPKNGQYEAKDSSGKLINLSQKRIRLLRACGVPDQLDVTNLTTKKTRHIHVKLCPFCGDSLTDGMGQYPIYTFLMAGLPSVGKTAFCEYITSQAQRQFVKELGLSISAPGKIAGARLVATHVGSSKLFRVLINDGQKTVQLNFLDVAGELFSNRRTVDETVEDGFYALRQTIDSLGNALDGCISMLDLRNLSPEFQPTHAENALKDAETEADVFLNWLRDNQKKKDFPILYIFNKSDQIKGTLTTDNPFITQTSLLLRDAKLNKRALAAHMALAQKFITQCCCSAATNQDPCFVIQLGRPQEDNTLYFDAAKNASLPLVFLLHKFKLCAKHLPD